MQQKEFGKNVTIIYGSNAHERSRILKEIITGKNSFELFEADINGTNLRIFRSSLEPIDIYYSECLAIDDFKAIIESKKAVLTSGQTLFNPKLVLNIATLLPAEVKHFGKMQHVSLIVAAPRISAAAKK